MKAIVFRLHLVEPALIAQAGAGEENSAVTLPYIPGSVLRGALASRWLAAHPGVDLAADPRGRSWFLDGTVCYLNAYPEIEEERSLPIPASWFTEKDLAGEETAIIYDLAFGPAPGPGALKPPKGGPFCRLERKEPEKAWEQPLYRTTLVGPARTDQVHIALENVNRRGEGNLVFRYEALAAGQDFLGVVLAPEGEDLREIKELLTAGDLQIGAAHLAGYGRVRVEIVQEVERGWREYKGGDLLSTGPLVVTLLSPAILRSDSGQIGWDGGQALAHNLGLLSGTRPKAVFGRVELMGGYNRKWSLPLPQAWALAAGSVFVFDVLEVDQSRLRTALDCGIGERRAEGFGRIAVNWQAAKEISRFPRSEPEAIAVSLSEESQRLARAMAQRRLRAVLGQELTKQVAAEAGRLRHSPSNAQLSAIRQAALAGWTQQSMKPLLDYLDNLKEAGRSQLEQCRIGNQTLSQWLRERAQKLDVEQQLLGSRPLPTLAGQTATLDQALRIEYTARLIDGVMKTTARIKQEAKR